PLHRLGILPALAMDMAAGDEPGLRSAVLELDHIFGFDPAAGDAAEAAVATPTRRIPIQRLVGAGVLRAASVLRGADRRPLHAGCGDQAGACHAADLRAAASVAAVDPLLAGRALADPRGDLPLLGASFAAAPA